MKKEIRLVLGFLFLQIAGFGQSYQLIREKVFGGTANELPVMFTKTNGSEFIVTALSYSDSSGNKTTTKCNPVGSEGWVFKIDTGFNFIWQKRFANAQTRIYLQSISNSANYFLTTISGGPPSCEKTDSTKGGADYWLIKIDDNGNKIWDKSIGGLGDESNSAIAELSTGEFLLYGFSKSLQIGGDKSVPNYGNINVWVVKIDSNGTKIWDRVYGGSNAEAFNLVVEPLPNGSFLLATATYSSSSGTISGTLHGVVNVWITLIDSAGNVVWDKMYGGNRTDIPTAIVQAEDGGFIIFSSTMSDQGFDISEPKKSIGDVWMLKIDSLGNKEWDRRFGAGPNSGGVGLNFSVAKAPGIGYWILGSANGNAANDLTDNGYGNYDYWVLLIDSLGNKVWDKRFGGPGHDYGYILHVMPDSSVVLAGHSWPGISSVKSEFGYGSADVWMLQFRYDPTITTVDEAALGKSATIYPNPTEDVLYVSGVDGDAEISIFNYLWQPAVHSTRIMNDTGLSIATLPAGVYLVRLQTKQYIKMMRFVKM
jgi:hypothetical protein